MKILIQFIFIFFLISVSAQGIKKTQDLGLWIGGSIAYDLTNDFKIEFEQQARFFESITELEKYITDIGIGYKINKNFGLGGNLRYYLDKEKDKRLVQDWRYNFDLKFKHKIGERVKFSYRLRFQSVYEDLFGIIDQGRVSSLRNKISIDYKLNKTNSLFVDAEIFRKLVFYRKPYFNKVRFQVGNELKTKIGKFKFAAGYERELKSDYPLNYFFGGVFYTFKIKK